MTFQKGFVKILLPNMKDLFALDPRFHEAGVLKIIPYSLCNIQKIRLTSHLLATVHRTCLKSLKDLTCIRRFLYINYCANLFNILLYFLTFNREIHMLSFTPRRKMENGMKISPFRASVCGQRDLVIIREKTSTAI